jgi:hypothetical protein
MQSYIWYTLVTNVLLYSRLPKCAPCQLHILGHDVDTLAVNMVTVFKQSTRCASAASCNAKWRSCQRSVSHHGLLNLAD